MKNREEEGKPNIIWILADDMGFSDIGAFGSEINTPHLDALSRGGLRMTQMYNGARCCPTRASLLTGLYAHQAGVGNMVGNEGVPPYQGYLRNDCATVAEVLRREGYRTFISGKWHVGGAIPIYKPELWNELAGDESHPTPRQRGFDRFYGNLGGAGSYFNPPLLMEDDNFVKPDEENYYYTDAISRKAVAMIDEDRKEGQPFFLYLAYTAPHWPLHARQEDIEKYRGKYHAGWDKLRNERFLRLKEEGLINDSWDISPRDEDSHPWEEAKNRKWESLRMAVYAAQVEAMDRGIGRVIEKLKEKGEMENTFIFFMSDNGGCAEYLKEDGEPGTWPEIYSLPTGRGTMCKVGNDPVKEPGPAETFMSYDLPWAKASNTPFRKFKNWTHEGGISTPFIAHWPKVIRPGRIDHTPAHIIDLMATSLDAAGAKHPKELGVILSSPWKGLVSCPFFMKRL